MILSVVTPETGRDDEHTHPDSRETPHLCTANPSCKKCSINIAEETFENKFFQETEKTTEEEINKQWYLD